MRVDPHLIRVGRTFPKGVLVGLLAFAVATSIPPIVYARPAPVTSASGDPTNDEGPKSAPVKAALMVSVPENQTHDHPSTSGLWLMARLALRTWILFAR